MSDIIEGIKQNLTLEKVLMTAMKAPGVKIKRDTFLKKELVKYAPDEVIEEAIEFNPARAGIPKRTVGKIANTVINYESTKVTALSVAASIPSSGAAAVALGAATADITSYFVFILRVVQELAYLYGFDQFDLTDDNVDSETMNEIMIFLGVMFGVQGANATLSKLASAMAEHVSKSLARKALTKGTIYPIVKQIAKKIGIRMTKQIFSDTVASAIPIAGSVLSGGLTFAMFKPCCIRLKNKLMGYQLCDPEYYKKNSESTRNDNIIDVDIES